MENLNGLDFSPNRIIAWEFKQKILRFPLISVTSDNCLIRYTRLFFKYCYYCVAASFLKKCHPQRGKIARSKSWVMCITTESKNLVCYKGRKTLLVPLWYFSCVQNIGIGQLMFWRFKAWEMFSNIDLYCAIMKLLLGIQ